MQLFSIENDFLFVGINSKGAEWNSLKNKITGLEYLWQKSQPYWQRQSPVLFPVVGRLRNDDYEFGGRHFSLTQHGFARDMEFMCVSQSKNQITFSLKSDAVTLAKYPFYFELLITYSLLGNQLFTTYQVINKSVGDLYFSIGAHPAFACPLIEGEKLNDYYLDFEKDEPLIRNFISKGLLTPRTEELVKKSGKLFLSEGLFIDDALVFHNLESTKVSLKSKNHEHSVSVGFSGFPYLGIWKQADAPFICIEPWQGITDVQGTHGKFEDKRGIIKLKENDTHHCEWFVQIS